MSAIKDLPTEKDFGSAFNYSVWSAGTAVTLCNVPWNSDYRDIVPFPSRDALDDYLKTRSGAVVEITRMSYAKFGKPIRLDIPFNAVQEYNYIRVNNPLQPIKGDKVRVFYYFITDVVYINPNCTEIYIQLDAWTTFGHTFTFGNCYIEQGHYGIANEDSFANFGRDNLTTPEGLDIGNEYQIALQYSHNIASARTPMPGPTGEPDYSILVASTISLDVEDYGTVDNPIIHSAKGSRMENLPNGCELYEFNNLVHFKEFMEYLSDKSWIAQGIISITAIPRTQRYGMDTETVHVGPGKTPVREISGGPLNTVKTTVAENWRNSIDLGRYKNLEKFFTFPYCVIEMTSYSGTPLVLKPECWGEDMTIVEVPHLAPPQPRIAFYPYRYNVAETSQETLDEFGVLNDGGEFMDMVTGIFNMPTFSIVNNGGIQYMAANAHSIAYQHASADWSQQRTMAGVQTSYDQASAGIGLSKDLTGQGINAANQQAALSNQTSAMRGAQSAGNSLLNGIGNRNPIGAAAGVANAAIGTAIDINQTNQSTNISNQLASGSNKSSTENMAYMRDTNKSLAEFSANGDYANQIAGINARVQDAKMIQPTTAGQVGGDAFNLATYRWGIDLKVKTVQPAIMRQIGEIWLRYGYKINRFGTIPQDFHVMEKFTYWKLRETYIVSAQCPEAIKQVIRGIFEKGVTVWRNPDDIGNIDIADNEPLKGLVI